MTLGLDGREGRVVAEERVDVEAVGSTDVVGEGQREVLRVAEVLWSGRVHGRRAAWGGG